MDSISISEVNMNRMFTEILHSRSFFDDIHEVYSYKIQLTYYQSDMKGELINKI